MNAEFKSHTTILISFLVVSPWDPPRRLRSGAQARQEVLPAAAQRKAELAITLARCIGEIRHFFGSKALRSLPNPPVVITQVASDASSGVANGTAHKRQKQVAKDVHATPKTTIEITAQIMQQFELDGRPEVAAKVEKEVVAAMSAYMAVDKAQIAADQACEALMIQQQEAQVFEEDNIAFISDDKSAFEADLAKARDRVIELERAIKDFDAQAAAAKVQSSVNEQLTAVLKQESDQATLNVN